jgi:hypothetical protein
MCECATAMFAKCTMENRSGGVCACAEIAKNVITPKNRGSQKRLQHPASMRADLEGLARESCPLLKTHLAWPSSPRA